MNIAIDLHDSFIALPFIPRGIHVGPGRKTLHTRHKNVDTNIYHRMEATAMNTQHILSRQRVRAEMREDAKQLVRTNKTGVVISRHKLIARENAKAARRAA